jgi:hypothetical protein
MPAYTKIPATIACVGLVLTLAACSGGSSLTTGTLLGGSSTPAAAPAPPPETATDRALHVAATSARASRCGYVFDPASVRQGFLAFEAQQGGAPDQLAKTEKSFDYTLQSISKTVSADENYCSDEQTATIKRDLNQVLAGNFSSPRKAPTANAGWWNASRTVAPMDHEKIFKPDHNR